MRTRRLLACTVLIASSLTCGRPSEDRSRQPETRDEQTTLQDLRSVEEFGAQFDADSAHPRLVLLLSPT